MKNKTTTFSILTKNQRQQAIKDIIDFFATERDQRIGVLAAEELLDFFLDQVGHQLYNQGIDDTTKLFQGKHEESSAAVELTLKKPE